MKKLTNDQLKALVSEYTTFTDLLKNRKLYYLLHNRGILKESTRHLKRKRPRNIYTKPVVDFFKLFSTMMSFSNYRTWRESKMSAYVILRRHGVDVETLFDNKDNTQYVKNLLNQFGQNNLENFLSK